MTAYAGRQHTDALDECWSYADLTVRDDKFKIVEFEFYLGSPQAI
jgi:hypothetical protein